MDQYYWSKIPNYGDALNKWLWPRLFPGLLSQDDDLLLVGVGSLINKELSYISGRKVIFGTGSGYGLLPSARARKDWIIYFVRGPLTASYLGLDPDLGIVDSSWLINRLPEFSQPRPKRGTVFIPHWSNDAASSWRRICQQADIRYISPLEDSVEVLHSLASAELAIVESLHGAILADYFRTPWIPLQLSKDTLPFKWLDWCGSVGLEYRPYVLPLTDIYHHVANRNWPRLAKDHYHAVDGPWRSPGVDQSVVQRPPKSYVLRRTLRPAVNIAKRPFNALNDLARASRNVWPLSQWNSRQEEILTHLLRKISRERSYLSSDSKRLDLIERINSKADALIQDYPTIAGLSHL